MTSEEKIPSCFYKVHEIEHTGNRKLVLSTFFVLAANKPPFTKNIHDVNDVGVLICELPKFPETVN